MGTSEFGGSMGIQKIREEDLWTVRSWEGGERTQKLGTEKKKKSDTGLKKCDQNDRLHSKTGETKSIQNCLIDRKTV